MKSVFGLANNEDHAQRIVNALLNSGIDNEEISILLADKKNKIIKGETIRTETYNGQSSTDDFSNRPSKTSTSQGRTNKGGTLGHEKHTKAPEGATTGAISGGIIGGSIGLLAGIGALAIPGLGAFIAAGPLLAALSGTAVGGSLGLFIGALVGLGIPEYEAKKYEKSLKQGNVLICVHVESSKRIDAVKNLLKQEGAHDIATSTEKAGSSR